MVPTSPKLFLSRWMLGLQAVFLHDPASMILRGKQMMMAYYYYGQYLFRLTQDTVRAQPADSNDQQSDLRIYAAVAFVT